MQYQSLAGISKNLLKANCLLARQIVSPGLKHPDAERSKRTPIVFYSQVGWDTVWQRPQELALGLSKYRRVYFVSTVQAHDYAFRLSEKWKPRRRIRGGELRVHSPLIFSGEYRMDAVRRLNSLVLGRYLSDLKSIDRFIYMTNSPFLPWFTHRFNPYKVVYDIIDDFCGFDWAPGGSRSWEDELLKEADLTFAGTGALLKKHQDIRPDMKFLPSGVRYNRMTKTSQEPADISSLPHPRVLYVGTLNDRLDGSLFSSMAKTVKEGSIIVVGPRHGSFEMNESAENIHFLGLKKHEDLPGYYQHVDIGIMPFGDNDAAQAINPVKTLEYLACGLPVLSTPVPDVSRYYSEVVRVEPGENWPVAIKELLEEDSPALRKKRSDFARNRSWSSLTRSVEQGLRKLERDGG